MVKCLRCKAGPEWIQGDPPKSESAEIVKLKDALRCAADYMGWDNPEWRGHREVLATLAEEEVEVEGGKHDWEPNELDRWTCKKCGASYRAGRADDRVPSVCVREETDA